MLSSTITILLTIINLSSSCIARERNSCQAQISQIFLSFPLLSLFNIGPKSLHFLTQIFPAPSESSDLQRSPHLLHFLIISPLSPHMLSSSSIPPPSSPSLSPTSSSPTTSPTSHRRLSCWWKMIRTSSHIHLFLSHSLNLVGPSSFQHDLPSF